MPLSPFRLSAAAAPLALAAGLATGASAGTLYPSDQCVSDKLRAVSRACKQVIQAHRGAVKRGDVNKLDERLGRIRIKLAKSWAKSEKRVAKSMDCSDTTRSSSELARSVEDAADAIAAAVTSGLDMESDAHKACAVDLLVGVRDACKKLLGAESRHLRERATDRQKLQLAADRTQVEADLQAAYAAALAGGDCPTDASAQDLLDHLDALAGEVTWETTVSPAVDDTGFQQIVPPREVKYAGRKLDPQCADGAEWSFWVKRGTVNKLLMYYQGGGACWDYLTCLASPTYKQGTGPGDDPDGFDSGFGDRSNPLNPFADWHVVFVPYCTGDIHWGDAVVHYESPDGSIQGDRYHKGFVNAQVAEKWAREHFVAPEMVFVTGSSAGAYGAVANAATLLEFVYPSSEFAVLGDAGNGVVTQDFLVNDLGKWGLEENFPEWIPGLNVPLTELNMADAYVELANTYPDSRFGTYTTAFDGGSGGQTGFYAIMLAGSPIAALSWWNASCAWNQEMRALNADAQSRAPNFRSYVGTGSAHTMWGRDKVYDDTTGGVPTVVDWVNAMIEGSPGWVDVECTDCGTTLPGDPMPGTLPDDPFDVDGNIVCPGVP